MKRSHNRPGPKKSCSHPGQWMVLLLFLALIDPRFAMARICFGECLRVLEVQQEQGLITGSSRIEAWNRPAAFFINTNSGPWRIQSGDDGLKSAQNGGKYIPTVGLNTWEYGTWVEIAAADDGYGIPENIINKIFQPLRAMRPTGEGTGLALSLSYDIIVKGHGGKLNVETIPGEMSAFVIILPQQSEA